MENIDITADNYCDGIDVEEAEAMGNQAMEVVQELVMNVDLTNIQFNVDQLMTNAEKIGFDLNELEEFGFDLKGERCGYKMCFDKDRIKSFDEYNQKGDQMMKQMVHKGKDRLQKLQCHPYMKENVMPKV